MKTRIHLLAICLILLVSSCVSKKKFILVEGQATEVQARLDECERKKAELSSKLSNAESTMSLRQEQMQDLRTQLEDAKSLRDAQLNQVEGLTALSQSATRNIEETLSQLEGKDKYIRLLQAAKSKTDSLNLALAVNLKSVLREGIEDNDVEVRVDKTVVFINLSDKMLFKSGSAIITSKADEVLKKIATIVESRPDFEVMVEGYTDNVPMSSDCITDNWDLSVQRATSVVRVLQNKHNIDPNRLIAAGRGEYSALASNDTAEGRSTNRRTRIVIMPQLDQFYDLLNPNKVPQAGDPK